MLKHGYLWTVFSKLVARLDYPMYVVTASASGRRAGCLVGFGTQTSIHPPRFLACISVKNRTYAVAAGATALAVHFLSDEPRQRQLAELFGGETGDDIDKFDRCRWHSGPAGVPLLDEVKDRFVGRVLRRLDLGDHVGFLLEPTCFESDEVDRGGGFDALGFQDARGIEPGHVP